MSPPRNLLLLIALSAPAFASVRAELLPGHRLVVDEPATLRITSDHADESPAAPHVDGANVQPSGEMSETRTIQGETHSQTTYLFTLTPTRTGSLDIPSVTLGGEATPPLHATVTSAPAPAGPPASGTSPAGRPSSSGDAHAVLRVELPARNIFVGQAVPVTVRALFRAGTSASLQGEPRVVSDAFTLSGLSAKPVQTQVTLHGVPYLQATWTGVLSPAKPGSAPFVVELPVELAYRDTAPARPHRSLRDLLGADPFGSAFSQRFFQQDDDLLSDMDSLFDVGQLHRRDLTLRDSVGNVVVEDPPAAGRPSSFSGAVGHFALSVEHPSQQPRVGEPLVVTTRVTGAGTFERLALQGLDSNADLKAYPARSEFRGGSLPLSGTKTFTQTVVPTHAGKLTLPPVTVAFFDPLRRSYETARSHPMTLDVQAATGASSAPLEQLTTALPNPTSAPAPAVSSERFSTLEPLYRQPRFWLISSALGLLLLGFAAVGFLRRSSSAARRTSNRRVNREVARDLREMDAAADRADSESFYAAARKALQTRLGARWAMTPEAVTAADVSARLGERGEPMRQVLERADRLAYASNLETSESLVRWKKLVRSELEKFDALPTSFPAPEHSP